MMKVLPQILSGNKFVDERCMDQKDVGEVVLG
jgi:hypothetical protein